MLRLNVADGGKILLTNVREIVKRLLGDAALLLTHSGKCYEKCVLLAYS